MTKHLLYFQQVGIRLFFSVIHFFHQIQAGLTSIEIKFHEWQWEEEETIFTLEHVGLGEYVPSLIFNNVLYTHLNSALIINVVGLGISTIIFIIEIIYNKI